MRIQKIKRAAGPDEGHEVIHDLLLRAAVVGQHVPQHHDVELAFR